jgi:hypothetical protein
MIGGADYRVATVKFEDGGEVLADLLLMSIGTRPNTELALKNWRLSTTYSNMVGVLWTHTCDGASCRPTFAFTGLTRLYAQGPVEWLVEPHDTPGEASRSMRYRPRPRLLRYLVLSRYLEAVGQLQLVQD